MSKFTENAGAREKNGKVRKTFFGPKEILNNTTTDAIIASENVELMRGPFDPVEELMNNLTS